MKNLLKKSSGFTLVELAIVLVIIGLIVSSVLVGQDLIKAMQMRATVRQLNDWQVATNTFVEKYGVLPGDANSVKYGLTDGALECDGAANNGDGDGLIEDSNGAKALHNSEISCFWSNLTTANRELIPGTYNGYDVANGGDDEIGENMPAMKFGNNGWGVFSSSGKNYFTTGVVGGQADDGYDTDTPFTPLDAFNIDSKIDDGVPTSGTVQSRGAGTSDPDAAALTNAGVSTAHCNNTTPTPDEYQFSATATHCNLRFLMDTP